MSEFLPLVATTVDLESPNGGKDSALLLALSKGDENGADILLAACANPNKSTIDGTTPLMMAIEKNLINTINLLLHCEADVNKKNHKGKTALRYAIELGNEEIIQLLLSYGASASIADENGDNSLITASEKGQAELIDLLLESGVDVDAKNNKEETALLKAAASKTKDEKTKAIIEKLIETGANINAQDADGNTPLILACKSSNLDLVETLVKGGADPQVANKEGKTVTNMVAEQENKILAEKLIELKVSFSAEQKENPFLKKLTGVTWHTGDASKTQIKEDKSNEIATKIAAAKAEKEKEQNFSQTHETDSSKIIVKNEAQNEKITLVKSAEQKEAEDNEWMVREFGNTFTPKSVNLKSRNKLGQTPVIVACVLKNINLLKTLVTSGYPIKEKDFKGNTALAHSAEQGFVEGIEYLIEQKAEIDSKNEAGQTPLWMAVAKNQVAAAQALIKNKANKNIKSKSMSLIMLAASLGQKNMVQFLFDLGLDPNATDSSGKNAANHAAINQHVELASWILSGNLKKSA